MNVFIKKRFVWVLAVLTIFLVIADVLTTRIALGMAGRFESNKFVAWIISKNLDVPFDIAKVLFIAWAILPARYCFQSFRRGSAKVNHILKRGALLLAFAYYSYLSINNVLRII